MQMQKSLTKDKSVLYDYKNIGNLTKEEVIYLLTYLTDRMGKRFIMMGSLLSVIRKNKWYEPYKTFMDFCDSSIGLTYRKSMYLIQIYENLITNHIPFDDIESSGLGYTKFVLISGHLTEDNYKSVIEWAKGVTTQQIEEFIKTQADLAKGFIKKVKDTETLAPDYKETTSTKITKPEVSDLKQLLITTPVTMVVTVLAMLYPSKEFSLS